MGKKAWTRPGIRAGPGQDWVLLVARAPGVNRFSGIFRPRRTGPETQEGPAGPS
ncbi:hypothetical protein DESPIG_03069 [Desulfovibrio piger ATCC 29098]|uniref:Uncharacterized protein n=1 Tax=Desulfovibrio piger ATCC 29098 TaxID=411464 RepID=B6WY88_9BACT|nr:hypothetical protein DESPIG_03069 [Desulfovibrio piger ATCC 29098]